MQLLTAAILSHGLHALAETSNINSKLSRLTNAIAGKPLKPYPVNIDTRPKALGIGFSIFFIFAAILFGLLRLLPPSVETMAYLSLGIIVFVDLFNVVNIDKYHIDIQKLINKFDNK